MAGITGILNKLPLDTNTLLDVFTIEVAGHNLAKTIEIRRKHKIKLPDAIIAATALVHHLTLVTNNVSDFARIENLLVVNPFAAK
ncbi:PIN domain-containing protein [Arundinibacter roseus]|uniref:Type II toxin-antitoxin system VapC family toxin n=1 Tax=Arundinibacter roseus TaxID=2070510 RepID=A0A4R4K4D7_9BACT|nr:type II toxin-antitoxin system VapC family toxin [Arundinibacter roseus]